MPTILCWGSRSFLAREPRPRKMTLPQDRYPLSVNASSHLRFRSNFLQSGTPDLQIGPIALSLWSRRRFSSLGGVVQVISPRWWRRSPRGTRAWLNTQVWKANPPSIGGIGIRRAVGVISQGSPVKRFQDGSSQFWHGAREVDYQQSFRGYYEKGCQN